MRMWRPTVSDKCLDTMQAHWDKDVPEIQVMFDHESECICWMQREEDGSVLFMKLEGPFTEDEAKQHISNHMKADGADNITTNREFH